MEKFLTETQERRARKDMAVYTDYAAMMVPGQSKTEVIKRLMAKYEIGSASTVYIILKRVGEKLGKEARYGK